MPDISEELSIIASEPTGKLVKKAIYDALVKINQEADRRPVAKLGIPIDEAIIDTGWVTDWVVGEMIEGVLIKFDGAVDAGGLPGEHYTSRIVNYFVNASGRAFVAAVVGYSDGSPDYSIINTDISGTDKPEWELVNDVSLGSGDTMITRYNKVPETAPIQAADLGFDLTHRGVISDASELPESAITGDLYLCQENDILNFYYYDGEAWVNGFETYNDDAYIWLVGPVGYHLVIWTAIVHQNTTLDIQITSDSAGYGLSAALITCYDSQDYPYTPSTTSYRVLGYDIMYNDQLPVVDTAEELPDEATEGSAYYVYQENKVYVYDSGSWYGRTNMKVDDARVDEVFPDYIYIPEFERLSSKYNGMSRATAKILVCVGTWGTEDKKDFITQIRESDDLEYFKSRYVSSCTMSIVAQHGNVARVPFPFAFNPEGSPQMTNDFYKMMGQEGFYVIPIEIGPRESRG